MQQIEPTIVAIHTQACAQFTHTNRVDAQTVRIHTPSCKTLKRQSVITAISGDDGVLMSTLTSATSLGSQLADNYERPQSYHNDSSMRRA